MAETAETTGREDYSSSGENSPAGNSLRARLASISRRGSPAPDTGTGPEEGESEGGNGQAIFAGEQTLTPGQKRGKNPTGVPPKVTITQAREAAKDTLSPLNDGVRMLLPAAVMSKDEAEAITSRLARIYMRHPAAAETVTRYSDPITLALALGIWLTRVWVEYLKLRTAQVNAAAPARQGFVFHDHATPPAVAPAPTPIRPAPAPAVNGTNGPVASADELQSIYSQGRE